MFSRLWGAFVRVADAATAIAESLFALADTFRQTNAVLRERFQLEAPPAHQPLPEPPAQLPTQQLPVVEAPVSVEPETPAKGGRKGRNGAAV